MTIRAVLVLYFIFNLRLLWERNRKNMKDIFSLFFAGGAAEPGSIQPAAPQQKTSDEPRPAVSTRRERFLVKWDTNATICDSYEDAFKAATDLAGGPVSVFAGEAFNKTLKCVVHTQCIKLGQAGHKSGFRVRIYKDGNKVCHLLLKFEHRA